MAHTQKVQLALGALQEPRPLPPEPMEISAWMVLYVEPEGSFSGYKKSTMRPRM